MKLSCLPVSYYGEIISGKMSIGQWAREAARLGLDAMDLSVLFLKNLDTEYLDKVRCEIDSAGMPVAMVASYPDFTHPDRDERQRQIETERDYIRAAGRLGAALVRVTAGQAHPGLFQEDGIRWALEGLKACEEVAQQSRIRLVLENHARPGCWDYSDFDHPTHIFLALADGIRGTTIGINFDTANSIAYGDDPLPILQRVVDQVVSVHAADTSTHGTLTPVLLGTGLVPFKELFSYLKQSDFDDWVCVEEASGLGLSGMERAVTFVRQVWEEA